MIRQLPPAPSRDRPNEFSGEMDAFLAAMQPFADDANALEQSLQVVATTGTSTTSLAVGVGSKSLTTQAGKAWATGAWVYVFAAAAVSNYMVGRVTSYDTETGALVVNVSAIDGSGTHSSWIIGLATPAADGHLLARDGSRAMTAELMLAGNAANALGAVPKQQAESLAAAARSTLASLTVTVSANTMTATLQPETLDFRSATLASGTPVSRSAAVAASLTVPSGATLGTVNGQSARIVWGWLDNAGTLEPFVSNLAGGVNLDETTLISTTAISGTANSAGVIYSQVARSNVAFRVRGFCDTTQATAGTWATAPTLVQGAGGQALAALAALGYGQTWQVVTRNGGTTYYNTTGKPIVFNAALQGDTGLSSSVSLSINGGSPVVVCQTNAPAGVNGLAAGSLIIPVGASYNPAYSNAASVTVNELR